MSCVSTLFQGVPGGLNLPEKTVIGTRVLSGMGKKYEDLVLVYDWSRWFAIRRSFTYLQSEI